MRILAIAAALVGLPAPASAQGYDLLLRGGHVIDPAGGVNARRDVAVTGGKIAAVERSIPPGRARKVVDVSGLYVTPGLIDLHGHVEPRSHPADMNLASGVTTVVDAGSAGARNFARFKDEIIARARIRVLAFLHIISDRAERPDEPTPEMLDAQLCAETARQHPDLIVGVKLHARYPVRNPPWLVVDRALECGRLTGLPVMADFWPREDRPYEELILSKLRPGDIHTHLFAQQFPVLDGEGRLNPALRQARGRGVYFDLGHGAASFWFRNAVPAVRQGFLPDTISTDLHSGNVNGPVVNLATTVSKMLAMGVPLEDAIRRTTVNPAKIIRRPELGTLAVGREADIAVLELRRGRFGYTDNGLTRLDGRTRLENRMTVRAGAIVYDPEGLSMVEWTRAPRAYFRSPRLLRVDPSSSAEPPDAPWRRAAGAQRARR